MRLWLRGEIDHIVYWIDGLQHALVELVERHAATVMPGFTHMQVAQPVTFGHHLLAYTEMFERDRARLFDARKRVNCLPLRSAALAGTTYPINRGLVAQKLDLNRSPKTRSMQSAIAILRSNFRPPRRW